MEKDVAATPTYFYVQLSGNTSGAHLDFVKNLKGIGQIQVTDREESDYLLVFCPILSRLGPDVEEALEQSSGGKPIVLVVMYHTFNRDYVVPDVRRSVDNLNVNVIVSCLYYNGKLLRCNKNDIAWFDMKKFCGVSASQMSRVQTFGNFCRNWLHNNRILARIIGGSVLLVTIITVITVVVLKKNKDL